MIIWRYDVPTETGLTEAYGCPIDIYVGGRLIRAVYQFQGGGQVCAVVHWQSGQIIARIGLSDTGYPQQRAQSAVNARLHRNEHAKTWATINAAPVVNLLPEIVGCM